MYASFINGRPFSSNYSHTVNNVSITIVICCNILCKVNPFSHLGIYCVLTCTDCKSY